MIYEICYMIYSMHIVVVDKRTHHRVRIATNIMYRV